MILAAAIARTAGDDDLLASRGSVHQFREGLAGLIDVDPFHGGAYTSTTAVCADLRRGQGDRTCQLANVLFGSTELRAPFADAAEQALQLLGEALLIRAVLPWAPVREDRIPRLGKKRVELVDVVLGPPEEVGGLALRVGAPCEE